MVSPNGVDSPQELVEAQTLVWNLIFTHINSMSLKCALQLGIPDIIHKHGKPITLSQLAEALPAINKEKSDGLRRLMRILVHSKLFDKVKNGDEEAEEGYCLTRASRLLLRDKPFGLVPFALSLLDPGLTDPFHHMSDWFGNESPSPFVLKHGKSIYEFAGIEQGWNRMFNEAMANDARLVSSVLVQDCRDVFEGLEIMVDVGGGIGTMAKAIADAFPGLKSIVLELPHVIAGLEGCENLSFVSGDMFESVPHGDAVFFKWILHNWNDEECVKILENCKEALTPSTNKNGGKVIIVDIVVDDKKEDDVSGTQLLFDMVMMTEFTGKERTEEEWAKLFYAAGFKSYKIIRALHLRSVIEVFA